MMAGGTYGSPHVPPALSAATRLLVGAAPAGHSPAPPIERGSAAYRRHAVGGMARRAKDVEITQNETRAPSRTTRGLWVSRIWL